MKEAVLATAATAVAAVGVAAVCFVCTDRVAKLCDETRKDMQISFVRAINAPSEKVN